MSADPRPPLPHLDTLLQELEEVLADFQANSLPDPAARMNELFGAGTPFPLARPQPSNPLCGARRKRDGRPCQAAALPNGRCRFHGGQSTGPKTPAGRIRARANLKQYRDS